MTLLIVFVLIELVAITRFIMLGDVAHLIVAVVAPWSLYAAYKVGGMKLDD